MSVAARADDLPLMIELQRSTGLGSVRPSKRWGPSKPQVTSLVTAKSDAQRLAELLARYPLRGQKSRAYAIWRGALEWWIDGDPTVTHRNRDWSPMRYLHARLSESKRYSPGTTTPSFDPTIESADLAEWRLLLDLRAASGAGRVTREYRHRQYRAVAAAWAIRDREGLRRMVAIFDEDPPRGRRRREYAIWREAAHDYARPQPGPALWARLS